MTPRELGQRVREVQAEARERVARLPALSEAEQERQADKARRMKQLMPEGFALFRELCAESLCDGYRGIVEVKILEKGAGNGTV